MRILFLVLLLILNVYAEAKDSGTTRSSSKAKKAKSEVVAKKSTTSKSAKSRKTASRKASKKSANLDSASPESTSQSDTTDVSSNFANPAISATSVADTADEPIVVRDTIVDTIYVVRPELTKSESKPQSYNIPLPHQSAYLKEGFSVGLGAGLFNASEDCDCLGVWQGQLEYHYRDYVTGGFDVRFFGGTLDRDVMLMYQRYRLNVKFHKSFTVADFYAGAVLGLETTDLSEFRKELKDGVRRNRSDEVDSSKIAELDSLSDASEISQNSVYDKNCEKMFSLDGFTLGVEVGMGVTLSRYFGLLGSASYEFNFSWAQLVSFSPGVAFNLHEIWPWGRNNLRSTWVSFEMIFQRYFNRDVNEWAVAGFLGLQFGI